MAVQDGWMGGCMDALKFRTWRACFGLVQVDMSQRTRPFAVRRLIEIEHRHLPTQ